MAEVGQPLDPWQSDMVMGSLGLRPDGFWSAFECVGLVPRQNGKGGWTEALELSGLFLFGDKLIMHSAHLFKTAKMSFQRLVDIIDGSDWLTRRVQQVVRARGDEAIILTPQAGGGQLMCFSRSLGAGRGFTGDRTVFDEAQYLTIAQYAAATPTLATVPNPQIIYTATPPDDDVGPMPNDAMLPSVRERGHDGEDRVALWEWSLSEKADPRDVDVWYECNPALGIRIQEWFLAKQLANFTKAGKPGKFATEHLGLWPAWRNKAWSVISEADWSRLLEDPRTSPTDPVVFAVDITPERTYSSIAVVGRRADGDLHGEVVDHAEGTSWTLGRLVELNARWEPAAFVVDPGGAAGFLLPELEAQGLPVRPMTSRQVGQAYGMFRRATSSSERVEVAPLDDDGQEPVQVPRLWVRPNRHVAVLAAAVEGASTRRVGDGTTWDRRSNTVVISPVVSLTNAVWGLLTLPVPEPAQPFFAEWR